MLTQEQKDNFFTRQRYYKLTDFEISIQQGNIDLFNAYLNEIPNIDLNRKTMNNDSLINLSLQKASLEKDYTIPTLILNHSSFDIKKNHNDPILNACLLNDFNIFNLLVDKGFDVKSNINNYIETLISKGIMLNPINTETLDFVIYLIDNYTSSLTNELLLFHVIFYKQLIKRSESVYSEEEIKNFNNKANSLFFKITDRGGYNKNAVWKEEKYNENIIHYLVKHKDYELLSYILTDHPEDIYYYVKGQNIYPFFYSIMKMDMELFEWLLNNTKIKMTKNNNEILPLSYIIQSIEDNKKNASFEKIYKKRLAIFEDMFNKLIDEGFSPHSSFRDLSSAYSLLLLSDDIIKEQKFRLLDKLKKSPNFNINLIDSNTETVFSLIYTNNDYHDVLNWLLKNEADMNYNNISSLGKIVYKHYDLNRLLSILEIDDNKQYHKINNETIYHTLLKSQHDIKTKFNLLNIFYKYNYDILAKDQNDLTCIEVLQKEIRENIFINGLKSFYQSEYLTKKMQEKTIGKHEKHCITKRI